MLKLLPMTPHTQAKHMLLKRYLDRWFPIVGKEEKSINYIDGFAGPGEYLTGYEGSPQIAIGAAVAHVNQGSLPSDVKIAFSFIEADPESANHLRKCLAKMHIPRAFEVDIIPGEFAHVMSAELGRITTKGMGLAPTFAFVDPFGFSGIPHDLMARILRFPKCEVFVNIMVEFINRFLEHPSEQVVAHFPETFGTSEVLDIPQRIGDREAAILSLYRNQLSKLAKYVGRFDMHGKRDQKTYSLFFASNHPRGFEKMKEAMWSVDRFEGAKFSDANPEESRAFGLFPFWALRDLLFEQFQGQRVLMRHLESYVVERTDFLTSHARSILKDCEKKGDITIEPAAGYKRRAGTFKEDKVYVKFPSIERSLSLF